MSTTTPIDPDVIRAEAQKDAWQYDHIDDACPYPFGTVEGVMFKEAFLTAQAQQRAAIATAARVTQ